MDKKLQNPMDKKLQNHQSNKENGHQQLPKKKVTTRCYVFLDGT
jgi:hypothetical protein